MSNDASKSGAEGTGPGILYIVSAPSGTGKTSLVKAVQEALPGVTVSISYTTRPRRPGEREGVDYHFVDPDRFRSMIEAGAFLEYAEVFGNFYGTARHTVDEVLARGEDVLLEIDWQGARQVRDRVPHCRSIFILPPSREVLAQRLRARGQDEEAVIARRLAEAVSEMSHYEEYDFLIINDRFEEAVAELQAILRAGRLGTACQARRHRALLRALLS